MYCSRSQWFALGLERLHSIPYEEASLCPSPLFAQALFLLVCVFVHVTNYTESPV